MVVRPSIFALVMAVCAGCSEMSSETGAVDGFPALPDYFDCIDESEKTLISAHRGGPTDGYPENALETLKRTVSTDDIILLEVDIRTSADGVLFLHHDRSLDRTTTGSGPVSEAEWNELRELNLRDQRGETVPYRLARLDETLVWSEGKALIQLDIKRDTDYDDVALVVREAAAGGRVIPIAYSVNAALALSSRFPDSMISVPVETDEDLQRLEAGGLSRDRILAWTGNDEARPPLFDRLDDQTIEVIFGTLGGRDSIDNQIAAAGNISLYKTLSEDGVDILATDAPVVAKNVLIDADRWADGTVCRR